MICALARYTPCPKEGRKNGANCVEFTWLYLTQSELHETRMIHCSLGSLPCPEKVPFLVRIAQNLHHSRMLSANGAKFAQFVSICCSLGSLPGPEKVPLLVRIARNLRHLWMFSANGAKFAQFTSNTLYLSTKD